MAGKTDLNLFALENEAGSSPILAWLPPCLAVLAAVTAASVLCPVPVAVPVLPGVALRLTARYVASVSVAGVIVLLVSGCLVNRARLPAVIPLLLPFCTMAAWLAPVAAFYARDSIWSAITVMPLAAFAVTLAYGHKERLDAATLVDFFNPASAPSLGPKFLAALLLQLAAVFLATQRIRAAVFLLGLASFQLFWFRRQGRPWQPSAPPRLVRRTGATIGLGFLFMAASFTPYLRSNPAGVPSETASEKPGSSANPPSPSPLPLALLQALFGDRQPSPEPPENNEKGDRGIAAIVVGDSYKGMILRPEVKDSITLVPPPPSRRLFDNSPGRQRPDPVSIPFYGAYWFFRTSDKTLPPGAVESRGEPASLSFRTTDLTPMTMEARQNFGTLIDLACCKAIQLVISNGDRRPDTVAIELIVRNTRAPGQPQQSLGLAPVTSALRWHPGDNKPPVTEVLSFQVPPQLELRHFDEVVLRFDLRSPWRTWSARISIERFRFIPRVF